MKVNLTNIPIQAEEEAKQLLAAFPDQVPFLFGLLERQLNILHQRSQVVIGFAAVAITTTGFSGRTIAGTSTCSQVLIIVAMAMILVSCLWIFLRVLAVKWVLTRSIQREMLRTLAIIIASRDSKTAAYRLGSIGVFLGLAIYAAAMAIMLLNPTPMTIPVR
ncbi:MAG: hypothetical protein WCG66_08980 [bacterium]